MKWLNDEPNERSLERVRLGFLAVNEREQCSAIAGATPAWRGRVHRALLTAAP